MRPGLKISQSDIITLRKWLWELRFRPARSCPYQGAWCGHRNSPERTVGIRDIR